MKKLFYLFIFLLIFSSQNLNISFAENSRTYYAKVEGEGYFFSAPNENSKLFQLPSSFFVLLVQNENDTFYKAKYKDISGFVKKSEVTPMSGSPTSPYPEARFRVFAKEGLGLFSQPNSSSTLVSTIPYLYEDIDFYGYMTGDEDIPKKSKEWFYCSYLGEHGYLYSVFCDSLPKLEKNLETFDVVIPDFSSNGISAMNSSSLLWIIIGVGLPSLVVLALLLKPSLIKEKILNGKTKPKRRKDYFEFDDSSLN